VGNVKIPCIILLTHGRWGDEIIKSTEMITGPMENIYAFSLSPEMDIKTYTDSIKEVLKHSEADAILITDLYCSTTTNVALSLSKDFDINIITGLNMYLLIQIDKMRRKYNLSMKDELKWIIEENRSKCDLLYLK
jgi:mannose/fructose-specific phosphotransferase system component IIA